MYYLEISALGYNSPCWISIPKLKVVIYILIMQEGQSRQKTSQVCFPEDLKGTGIFSWCIFGEKPYACGQTRGEAWRGMKSALAASQVEERQGWAHSLTGLIVDAAVSVVLLLVMSKLLPTTWAIKKNEKNYLGKFSSVTDLCVPDESLETFHSESVFSHSGDRKGEDGGPTLF